MQLTKEQLLNKKPELEEFDCSPYGLDGFVFIKEFDALTREKFEETLVKMQKGNDEKTRQVSMRALILSLCISDADGNLLFDISDIPRLARTSSNLVVAMYKKAKVINKLGDDEKDKEEKKSEPTQSEGSSSD